MQTSTRPATTPAPAPAGRSFPRVGFFVFVGLALLAATLVGTGWLLNDGRAHHSTGDSGPPPETDFIVGFGHVDVESRVINLTPVQQGEVVEIPDKVKENAEVKKGDLLLRIDDQQAKLSLATAQDALRDAELKLKQAEQMPEQHASLVRQQDSAVEAMKRERDRLEALYQKAERLFTAATPLVSKEDRDFALQTFEKAKQGVKGEIEKLEGLKLKEPELKLDIDRARVDVSAKKTRRDQAKYALEKHELRAPVDGMVLRLLVSVGDVIGPTPKEPAIIFCPAQPRIIRAEVEQEFAAKIRIGQPALIQDDARLSGEWRGEVIRISDWYLPRRSIMLEPRQFNDVRTLEAIVKLNDSKGLKIGQRVRVIIGK